MSLNLSKSYTFAAGTAASSSQVNSDFDTLYNAFSGLEAGTSSMTKLPLDADPASALHAATKQYVDTYASYKRPQLTWISVSLVDVSVNTDTANKTRIQFPDGTYLSVTEDTSSANKYRRFDITAAANFTSGTEDSGLRSGITEAINTRYAIYAVKSQINSANFVLAGDTTFPTIANVATLNGRYGTNSWVYLGYIFNGNGAASNSDICNFVQTGNFTTFLNTVAATAVSTAVGVILATTAGATTLTYTYSAGSGSSALPDTIGNVIYRVQFASINNTIRAWDSGGSTRAYWQGHGNNANAVVPLVMPASDGIQLNNGSGSLIAQDILLGGFWDTALGVGSSPLI